MKNKVQQRASELHSFVAERTKDVTRRGNQHEIFYALGMALVKLAAEHNDAQFAGRVSDIAGMFKNFLNNAGEHAMVEVTAGDLNIVTLKALRGTFNLRAKAFEQDHMKREENFCRMCTEILRAFDTLDFSRSEGVPRACVKASYAGVDHDTIKHTVMLLF